MLDLCDGADLLIHDAQYTVDEFPAKADWGHCTVDYAVHVAGEAGARRLALFHHDPDATTTPWSTSCSLDARADVAGREPGIDEVHRRPRGPGRLASAERRLGTDRAG